MVEELSKMPTHNSTKVEVAHLGPRSGQTDQVGANDCLATASNRFHETGNACRIDRV
jgi:hypothetical protein